MKSLCDAGFDALAYNKAYFLIPRDKARLFVQGGRPSPSRLFEAVQLSICHGLLG